MFVSAGFAKYRSHEGWEPLVVSRVLDPTPNLNVHRPEPGDFSGTCTEIRRLTFDVVGRQYPMAVGGTHNGGVGCQRRKHKHLLYRLRK